MGASSLFMLIALVLMWGVKKGKAVKQ